MRGALRTLLADPAVGQAFVARGGRGDVVGYLVLLHGFSLEYGGRVGLVDELFVRDDLRGQGIGARLLDAAEAHGRRDGLAALQLEVGDANPRAYDLYRRRGYRDHDRHLMTRRLGPATPAPAPTDAPPARAPPAGPRRAGTPRAGRGGGARQAPP